MQRYWLPWLVGMPAETSRAMCSMIFGGIFERLPDLRVMFAHAGGSFLPTIGRIEHGFNCRPDLVAIDNNENPRKYLGKVLGRLCNARSFDVGIGIEAFKEANG
ncbi:MAG: amidohydrolase family protein [Cytophagales bacterium]|nr:amidohydrolase family protein [Cytophagales bacterium]